MVLPVVRHTQTIPWMQRSYMFFQKRNIFKNLNDFWRSPARWKKSVNRVKLSSELPYDVVKPGNVTSISRNIPAHIRKPDYAWTGRILPVRRAVEIKYDWQIERMRQSGLLARRIMNIVSSHVKPGITTDEIDVIVHEAAVAHGAYPSPLHYRGFPKSVCTSVNNVACHGIPDDRKLKDGDIITVDVTVFYNNFHGDCAHTFLVGDKLDKNAVKLIETAKACRDRAVEICKPGEPFASIGKIVTATAKAAGFKVMPVFCGHGIGSYFHGPPDIYHFANSIKGYMREGMTFTIEPVISEGTDESIVLEDGWTAVSLDNTRSAQFEHTVLVTKEGVEILTA